jgi:hypothetical protein
MLGTTASYYKNYVVLSSTETKRYWQVYTLCKNLPNSTEHSLAKLVEIQVVKKFHASAEHEVPLARSQKEAI